MTTSFSRLELARFCGFAYPHYLHVSKYLFYPMQRHACALHLASVSLALRHRLRSASNDSDASLSQRAPIPHERTRSLEFLLKLRALLESLPGQLLTRNLTQQIVRPRTPLIYEVDVKARTDQRSFDSHTLHHECSSLVVLNAPHCDAANQRSPMPVFPRPPPAHAPRSRRHRRRPA